MTHQEKTKLDVVTSLIICLFGIGTVAWLVKAALDLGVDGVLLSTGIAVILAIVLAYTGVKIRDVLMGK